MKYALLTALLLFAGSQATASQQTWQRVGSGDMHWAFFKLYNISLLTDDGTYRAGEYPLALEIRYYRDIDSEDLVKATDDQWQKLGIPAAQRSQWLDSLTNLWPDIRKNDTLRLEVDAAGVSRFLHNGQPVGQLDDTEFAASFVAIWLSPDTSRPQLRVKLIQGQTGNV